MSLGMAAGLVIAEIAFSALFTLHADASFELALPYFAYDTGSDVGFSPLLEELLGPRRPNGKAWDLDNDAGDRHYADVAATLQAVTESALLALAKDARARTGADALCLAGGRRAERRRQRPAATRVGVRAHRGASRGR